MKRFGKSGGSGYLRHMSGEQIRNVELGRVAWMSLACSVTAIAGTAHAEAADEKQVTQISLSSALRIDSNVARTTSANALRRGLDQADQRLTVGAELQLSRPIDRHRLAIDLFAGYDFYRRNSRLNRERFSLDANAKIAIGPCEVQLNPHVERKQSDLSQLSVINAPGVDSVVNTETIQDHSAQAHCGRPAGLSAVVRADYGRGINSNPLRAISNYRSEGFGAGAVYQNPLFGEVSFVLERRKVKYPHRNPAVYAGLTEYKVDNAQISAKRDLGSVLTAEGSIALSRLSTQSKSAKNFSGVTWNFSAVVRPMPNFRLTANLGRELKPSLNAEALYSRDASMGLTADLALTGKTTVSVGAKRNDRKFVGATAIAGPLLVSDRFTQFSGEVSFRASSKLKFVLAGIFERRNANGTIFDYHDVYGQLGATFVFGK